MQLSKVGWRHLAHAYHKEMGLPIVTVKATFNVYGEGQTGEGAMQILSKSNQR